MSYVKIPKENYDKALEELSASIELARKAKARIESTLRTSRRDRERREANLRRAGLLRD
jgi:multidrug resistance efflux pump